MKQDLQQLLLFTFIFLQIVLWLSYFIDLYLEKRIKLKWFGDIDKKYHKYFLTTASIAYLFNVVYVFRFPQNVPENVTKTVIMNILVYYVLQLLFIPLLKLSVTDRISKQWVSLLLAICVIPMYILMKVGLSQNNTDLLFKASSMIPFIHVFFNDAILFGLCY